MTTRSARHTIWGIALLTAVALVALHYFIGG